MSLKGNVTVKGNLPVNDAYLKVSRVEITNGSGAEVVCGVYVDEEENNKGNLIEIKKYSCSTDDFDLFFSEPVVKESGKSVISQAYEYLKSLNEFSGATDV